MPNQGFYYPKRRFADRVDTTGTGAAIPSTIPRAPYIAKYVCSSLRHLRPILNRTVTLLRLIAPLGKSVRDCYEEVCKFKPGKLSFGGFSRRFSLAPGQKAVTA